jgi:hypothetical protein
VRGNPNLQVSKSKKTPKTGYNPKQVSENPEKTLLQMSSILITAQKRNKTTNELKEEDFHGKTLLAGFIRSDYRRSKHT